MAYGYYVAIKDYLTSTGFFPCLVIVACFTAGASLTMWLGERIDENGIGNGISMVLFAGIVARGPQLAGVAWEYITSAFNGEPLNLLWVILALAFMTQKDVSPFSMPRDRSADVFTAATTPSFP